VRAYDALIAATALAHQLPVYTCNPGDFDKIDGLQVVPVRLPRACLRLTSRCCRSEPLVLAEGSSRPLTVPNT